MGENRDTRGQYNRAGAGDRRIDDGNVTRSIDSGFRAVDSVLSSFGKLVDAVSGTEQHVRDAADELRRPAQAQVAPSTDTTMATTSWKWSEVIDAETGRKLWIVQNAAGERAECSSYELAVTIANMLNLKTQADQVTAARRIDDRGQRAQVRAAGNGRGAY